MSERHGLRGLGIGEPEAVDDVGDGLVEDDEAVPVGREGVNSGALALAAMACLAWVILMVGA